jgi:hypothetical protein
VTNASRIPTIIWRRCEDADAAGIVINPRDRLEKIAEMMQKFNGTPEEAGDLFKAYDILTCELYAEESLKKQFKRKSLRDSAYLRHLLEDEL